MKNFKQHYYLEEKKRKKRKKRRYKFKPLRQYYGYPFWGPGYYYDQGVGSVGGGDSGGGGE